MTGVLGKSDDGILARIRLTPKSAKDQIVGIENDANGNPYLKVKVRAVPEKGKANIALINLLAKSLGLPKSSIEVISGHTSRAKTVLLTGRESYIEGKWEGLLGKD
jgi:uncharacterized protein (TIGR00251 family)